ncbi:MAG: hypothetical protein LBK53_00880 [Heliobacteriaceae bacterium]|nr:hypothetical protein [Heliobacteriaceae bacterium]
MTANFVLIIIIRVHKRSACGLADRLTRRDLAGLTGLAGLADEAEPQKK